MSDLTGRVWLFGDNIDTEVILPTVVLMRPRAEQAGHVLSAVRPGWAELVRPGDIIVAGESFGIGSGRPAPRVLKDLGIAAVIADSVAGLFLRGAVTEGLPCVAAPGVSAGFAEGDELELEFAGWIIVNGRTGARYAGQGIPGRLGAMMLSGGVMPFLFENGYIAAPRPLPAGPALRLGGKTRPGL
jgi:3-isopropylmalate/(R)-2-methylmalate dehydratase small subunit